MVLMVTVLPDTGVSENERYPGVSYVTYPPGEYNIGSEVTLTAEYFRGGDHFDPEAVSMTFSGGHPRVDPTWVATGRYEYVMIIQASDVDDDGRIGIWANYDDTSISDSYTTLTYLHITDRFPKRVDVYVTDPSDLHARPGDTVEFEVRTYNATGPMDPSNGTLRVKILDRDGGGVISNLEVARIDVGRFKGTFVVPESLRRSEEYTIKADATIPSWSEPPGVKLTFAKIYVDFIQVYTNFIYFKQTRGEMEVYALDLDGIPIQGANVTMQYYVGELYGPYRQFSKEDFRSVTDEKGRCNFTLNYGYIEEDDEGIRIEGEVEVDHVPQAFTQYCILPNHTILYGLERAFQVAGPINTFRYGDQVQWTFTALRNGEPLVNSTIYYSGLLDTATSFGGTRVTDSEGRFTVTFNTTDHDIEMCYPELNIYADIGSGWRLNSFGMCMELYTPYQNWVVGAIEECAIEIEPGELIDEFNVTVASTEADGQFERATLYWGMGDPHEPMYFWNGHWSRVYYRGTNVVGEVLCTWSNGSYHANVTIPPFILKDDDVFVIARIKHLDRPGIPESVGFEMGLPFVRNVPPMLSVDAIENVTNLSGELSITGTAWDDEPFLEVHVSIDDGPWLMANGTTRWNYLLGCDDLSKGGHEVHIRATDGSLYSPIETIDIDVIGSEDEPIDDGGFSTSQSIIIIVVVSVVLIVSAVLIRSRR
jgi:hypothetical protein